MVSHVVPEVKELYNWLEVDFHPLKLCGRVCKVCIHKYFILNMIFKNIKLHVDYSVRFCHISFFNSIFSFYTVLDWHFCGNHVKSLTSKAAAKYYSEHVLPLQVYIMN